MRRLLGSFALLATAAALPASEGSAWLKIPQGARSTALGTAVSSFDRGAEAQWYNPAGLARVRGLDLSLSRQAWLGKTRNDFAAVALPIPGGGVGALVNWLGNEDTYRDAFGNEGAKFGNSAWTAGLGLGLRAGFMSFGASGKVIQERYESKQYAGYASDLGAQAKLGPWLRLGGSIQNLGAWSGDNSLGAVDLPLTYRGGLALENAIPGVILSLEARALPRSEEGTVLAGAEYGFKSGLFSGAVRAGYEASALDLGGGAGLSLGAGAKFTGLKVDFAWQPYGPLGNPYRMTLGWDFSVDPVSAPAVATVAPDLSLPPSLSVLAVSASPANETPGGLEQRLAGAWAAYKAGRWSDAEAGFRALAEEYPANHRPFHGLFLALYRSGRHEEAIIALEAKLARAADPVEQAWMKRYQQSF